LHTTSLLITGGLVLLLNGFLLELTLAPVEALSIIVVLVQLQGEKLALQCVQQAGSLGPQVTENALVRFDALHY
jgi:hypothetical protein